MIFASLLLMASPVVGTVEAESEIVVIGNRARGVRWDWRINQRGVLTKCKITRSSGDPEIDQIGCEATRYCGATGLRGGKAMRNCIIARRSVLIRRLADARASD